MNKNKVKKGEAHGWKNSDSLEQRHEKDFPWYPVRKSGSEKKECPRGHEQTAE